jgi:hypothetical protein
MKNRWKLLIAACAFIFLNQSKARAAEEGSWDFATPTPVPTLDWRTPVPASTLAQYQDWFNVAENQFWQKITISTQNLIGPGAPVHNQDGEIHVALSAVLNEKDAPGEMPVSVTIAFNRKAADSTGTDLTGPKLYMLNGCQQVAFLLPSKERIDIPADSVSYQTNTIDGNEYEIVAVNCDLKLLMKLENGAMGYLCDEVFAFNQDTIIQVRVLLAKINDLEAKAKSGQ